MADLSRIVWPPNLTADDTTSLIDYLHSADTSAAPDVGRGDALDAWAIDVAVHGGAGLHSPPAGSTADDLNWFSAFVGAGVDDPTKILEPGFADRVAKALESIRRVCAVLAAEIIGINP